MYVCWDGTPLFARAGEAGKSLDRSTVRVVSRSASRRARMADRRVFNRWTSWRARAETVDVSRLPRDTRLRPTLVGGVNDLAQVAIEHVNDAQLFLLVLEYGLRRDQFLWHTTSDEYVVFFGDFDATLLEVELTDADAVAGLLQVELLGLVLGELDDIEPGNIGIATVGFEDAWRSFEESLEAFEQDGADGTSSQVAGQALVSLEYTFILAHQTQ